MQPKHACQRRGTRLQKKTSLNIEPTHIFLNLNDFQGCLFQSNLKVLRGARHGPLLPHRSQAEDIEKKIESKRQRTEEACEELNSDFKKATERTISLTSQTETWSKILSGITSQGRTEKADDQPWVEYFKMVTQVDDLEAPATFASNDLPYEDVIIKISSHLGALKKKLKLAENAAARFSKRAVSKQKDHAKREEKLREKAEIAINNPEKVLEKEKRSKQSDCIGMGQLPCYIY